MPVVVNRTLISDREINEESARVTGGDIAEKNREAARRLVIRELFLSRARELGIDVPAAPDAAVDEVLRLELRIPVVDDAACRQYFIANPERFKTPVTVELRHILLKAAPDDPEKRADAERQAVVLIAELKSDPARFGELAARHSACPSAAQGGHLGIVGRGQTVPEFESVVLRLELGLAARPVESRYGFHVVEALSRCGGAPLSYGDVRDQIAGYLHERSWRRAVHQYIQVLIDGAEIHGIGGFVQSDSLLLQ